MERESPLAVRHGDRLDNNLNIDTGSLRQTIQGGRPRGESGGIPELTAPRSCSPEENKLDVLREDKEDLPQAPAGHGFLKDASHVASLVPPDRSHIGEAAASHDAVSQSSLAWIPPAESSDQAQTDVEVSDTKDLQQGTTAAVATTVDDNTKPIVVQEGYLWKTEYIRRWSRIYFILDPDDLEYFQGGRRYFVLWSNGTLQGFKDWRKKSIERKFQLLQIKPSAKEGHTATFVLEGGGKEKEYRAESKREMQKWINAASKMIENRPS